MIVFLIPCMFHAHPSKNDSGCKHRANMLPEMRTFPQLYESLGLEWKKWTKLTLCSPSVQECGGWNEKAVRHLRHEVSVPHAQHTQEECALRRQTASDPWLQSVLPSRQTNVVMKNGLNGKRIFSARHCKLRPEGYRWSRMIWNYDNSQWVMK